MDIELGTNLPQYYGEIHNNVRNGFGVIIAACILLGVHLISFYILEHFQPIKVEHYPELIVACKKVFP